MRFSSVFQLAAVPHDPAAPRQPAPADVTSEPAAQPQPGDDLPEDLDARVRLIGEWQLGEAD